MALFHSFLRPRTVALSVWTPCLFLHSPVDGWWAGFCVLAAANRVVMNVVVHVCLGIMISEDRGTPGRGMLEFCGWSVLLYFQEFSCCSPCWLCSSWRCRQFSYFHAVFNVYCLEAFGGWPHSLVGGDTSWSFCISQIVELSKFSCGFLFFFFLIKKFVKKKYQKNFVLGNSQLMGLPW